MTRMTTFASPLLLGFDAMEKTLERIAKANDGYPPYNIERLAPDPSRNFVGGLRITLAVAGFSEDELDVTTEENQLIIRGRQTEQGERDYLHRGIAADLYMALLVVGQGPKVPVKSRLLLGACGLQFGQLHLGVQPGGDLGDRAAARGFAPPTEGPAHVPAGIAMKALPTHRNGGGGMQGRAQALTRLGAHHVGLLGVFLLHLRVYAAGAQQPSDCTRPACPGAAAACRRG